MKTFSIQIPSQQLAAIKEKALCWADQFDETVTYLDSNDYQQDKYARYECLLAVGQQDSLILSKEQHSFEALRDFAQKHQQWLFGYLTYDLKNAVEVLTSKNEDRLKFPELHFFAPRCVLVFQKEGNLEIIAQDNSLTPSEIWTSIQAEASPNDTVEVDNLNVQPKISKEAYLKTIECIKQHIVDGDLYEMNFCQEFFANDVVLEPLPLFLKMNAIAKAPFAAFYKQNKQYILCGSPERFMCKHGQKIISQPIKGTIKRGRNKAEDEAFQQQLVTSIKDQAENVMIVDLVRNDLTRSAKTGSIKVEELFGIYTFERVHQMISTVVSEMRDEMDWVAVLKNAFPMGSMTGAPKVMSMELIEKYESSKRGIYSGAIGYVTPERDFDFNVVIRSILYNQAQQYLSFQVGGAIVYDSDPAGEYEECLLKAATMLETLSSTTVH